MLMAFGKYIIGIAFMIGAPIWLGSKVVKYRRSSKWVAEHGALIGSDEHLAWCEKEGVDPGYYW